MHKELCVEELCITNTTAVFIIPWKQLNVSQRVLREINFNKCVW